MKQLILNILFNKQYVLTPFDFWNISLLVFGIGFLLGGFFFGLLFTLQSTP